MKLHKISHFTMCQRPVTAPASVLLQVECSTFYVRYSAYPTSLQWNSLRTDMPSAIKYA